MVKWKKLQFNFWKLENEGDSIEGILVGVTTGKYGNDNYKIKRLDNNETVVVYGSTILNDKMSMVKLEQEVKIEYLGKGTTLAGQEVKLWEVYVKEGGGSSNDSVSISNKANNVASKKSDDKKKTSVVMSKNEETSDVTKKRKFISKKKQPESDVEKAECPNCEKNIPIDSTSCPECGEKFIGLDEEESSDIPF